MRDCWSQKAAHLCTLGSLVLFTVCPSLRAEDAPQQADSLDALERSLELGRHEQLAAVKANPDSELNGFTTDGCSGGLSAGWSSLASKIEQLNQVHGSHPPWEPCCVTHDAAYHAAGLRTDSAEQSFTARKQADIELRSCVLDTGMTRTPELSREYGISEDDVELIYVAIADLMYRAVRLGGVPCTSLPWRWGYGWPECD